MTSLGFNIEHGSLAVLSWRGLTFQQVVSTLQKNTNTATTTKSFFSARPIKHYRKSIGRTDGTGTLKSSATERQSATIASVMEQPGGTVNTTVAICSNNGVAITTDPALINNSCDKGVCTTAPANALNRVRSAGMIRKRATYNVNSYQLLESRDKTFAQNQYNYIKTGNNAATPGSPLALLASNSYVQNGAGQFNVANNTVVYKPSNWKHGCQGGVSSSSRTDRLKYDNIQKVAYQYKQAYGVNGNSYKSSATYGGSNGTSNATTYGIKNKTATPTPQITRIM